MLSRKKNLHLNVAPVCRRHGDGGSASSALNAVMVEWWSAGAGLINFQMAPLCSPLWVDQASLPPPLSYPPRPQPHPRAPIRRGGCARAALCCSRVKSQNKHLSQAFAASCIMDQTILFLQMKESFPHQYSFFFLCLYTAPVRKETKTKQRECCSWVQIPKYFFSN